jgi:hypothetical protein
MWSEDGEFGPKHITHPPQRRWSGFGDKVAAWHGPRSPRMNHIGLPRWLLREVVALLSILQGTEVNPKI